jgi:pimeloyl-ACP methyl ester carboxylesterase
MSRCANVLPFIRKMLSGKYLLDPAAFPVLVIGMFMLVMLNTGRHHEYAEDAYFAPAGGDYKEINLPVHSVGRVYDLRVKYYDNKHYKGPPVIIVHGMGTSDSYFWRMKGSVEVFNGFVYYEERYVETIGLAQGLVDLGYDVVTYTYPDSRYRPLEYQAYDLHRIIEWTKSRFVKRSVILIGHSIGGLICRYYVVSGQTGLPNHRFEEPPGGTYKWQHQYDVTGYEISHMKYKGDVEKCVLFATPNLGSLAAGGKDYGSPALYQLTEGSDFLEWLELGREVAKADDLPDPEYYVFAGTRFENYMGQEPLDFGDGIVPVASAVGLFEEDRPESPNVFTYPLDHFELVMDGEVLAKLDSVLYNLAGSRVQ